MSDIDFQNGFITGMATRGLTKSNFTNRIDIKEIESTSTQLRIKYGSDLSFRVFSREYNSLTDTHTLTCTSNGAKIVISPMVAEDIIYIQT